MTTGIRICSSFCDLIPHIPLPISLYLTCLYHHKNYKSERLYLWGYLYVEIITYLTQFDTNAIISVVYIPIGQAVTCMYDGKYKFIYASVIVLTCDCFSV